MVEGSVASAVWGMASALAVAAIGLVSLRGGKARPRGAVAFALFAQFWGVAVFFGNLARILTTTESAEPTYLLFLAFLLPLPYFLAEFARSQATVGTRRAWNAVRFGAAAVAFTAAALLIFSPGQVYVSVEAFDGTVLPIWGRLYGTLVLVPFFVGLAIAIWTLWRAAGEAPTPRTARPARLFLLGLGIYVSFAAGNNFAFYVSSVLTSDPPLGFVIPLIATFAMLSALSLRIGVSALARAWRRTRSLHADPDGRLALAFLVPFAWGVIEGAITLATLPYFESVGLWRLAGVAVIAYGFASLRNYDLPQRVGGTVAATGGTVAAMTGGATTYGLASLVSTSVAVPAVAGVVVAGAALFPSIRFVKRFVQRAESAADLEDRLYGQRIDTYRAALESSLARGTVAEDEEFLQALRARFGITPEEDRVLRYYAKSSVLVPRDDATGAYERLRLLGEGGGGRTWLARDRARDRLVVLKEPLARWQREPAVKEAVLREARLAARVRHPNVVAIEEVIEHDGHLVIVMEYLDGGTLADLLASRGTLPWKEAAGVMMDVLRGVEAVHGAGIVHRDVKPSNILLTGEGTPKIADFGVALVPDSRKTVVDTTGPYGRNVPVATATDDDTLNTVRAGTPVYMAPEVRSGLTLGDRRADVYACAAVLHECLYGTPPAPGAAVVVRDDVPAPLTAVLARGLSAHPDQRFPTARAFAEELSRVVRS